MSGANPVRAGSLLIHEVGLIGADEAGRGPIAGPVVAAAVVLPDRFEDPGLRDSKQLAPMRRAKLCEWVKAHCSWAVAIVSAEEIDRLNILQTSLEAMAQAVEALGPAGLNVAVDGNQIPRRLVGRYQVRAEIKGDGRFAAIAAASIVAKETRDGIMREFAAEYPEYGFERHFGYPTPDHLSSLTRFGPCPIHRKSFGPVASLLNQAEPKLTEQKQLFDPELVER